MLGGVLGGMFGSEHGSVLASELGSAVLMNCLRKCPSGQQTFTSLSSRLKYHTPAVKVPETPVASDHQACPHRKIAPWNLVRKTMYLLLQILLRNETVCTDMRDLSRTRYNVLVIAYKYLSLPMQQHIMPQVQAPSILYSRIPSHSRGLRHRTRTPQRLGQKTAIHKRSLIHSLT